MVTTQWVMDCMETWAPLSAAEEWDNVGLLLGDAEQPISRVLVALDATEAVVAEAIAGGYDLLVTHHPLIFTPLQRVTMQDVTGRKIIRLTQHGISLYTAHTNLDRAPGGTSDLLFEQLALHEKEPLLPPAETEGAFALGRVGYLSEPLSLKDFAAYIAARLPDARVRYAGAGDASVHRVAVCAGDASGSRYCRAAKAKHCDVYVTGDLRYHGTQEALEAGLLLVDITHYAGEAPVVDAMVAYLQAQAAGQCVTLSVTASSVDGQVFTHHK